MAGNNNPIFSRVGAIGLNAGATLGTTQIQDYIGTNAGTATVFTADATNGGYVQRLRFKALGANATAAVARVFFNNGSTKATAANNTFYGEVSLPITSSSTTAATVDVDYPINVALPPGYSVLVNIGSSANLGAGWAVTAIAGAY
jgi:hypothetical protein